MGRLPKEQDTVKAILDYLHLRGIPAWRMNTGAFVGEHKGKRRFHRFGVPGMADIVGILRDTDGVHTYGPLVGRFLAIEVKRRGQKPSEEQVGFLSQVSAHCGKAFVAYSVDDVQRELGL